MRCNSLFFLLPSLYRPITFKGVRIFYTLLISHRMATVSTFQTASVANQRGCGIRGQHPMGIGWYVVTGMDTLLLLHLEGRQVDWQSRLFHFSLPVRVAHCPPDSRHHAARRHGGYSVLHQSKLVQTSGIRGKLTYPPLSEIYRFFL